jgi:hypothetical protein
VGRAKEPVMAGLRSSGGGALATTTTAFYALPGDAAEAAAAGAATTFEGEAQRPVVHGKNVSILQYF